MSGISKASHGGFLVCCVLLAFTTPVGGATFNVNSATDLSDSNPGDGVCSASGVFCTLRAAIEESNALGGSNVIILPEGTYLLTLGELEVLTDIDLQGAGAASCVVDGNNSSRVFNVDSFTMRASGLTVQNGNANNYGGGGFRIAPSTATLILEDAVVRNNSTVSGGAGIMNEGTLSITRTILSGNASPSGGGAIWSVGTLTVFATEITGNTSSGGYGGGLLLGGSTELTDVTISGNTAAGYFWVDRWLGGGGIFSTTLVTLERVTLEDNFAKIGGGIHFEGTNLTITNSTFTNNGGSLGGGAIHVSDTNHHNLNLTNVTIAGNLDSGLGGGAISLGTTPATVAIANTIIADNGADQCDSNSQIVSFGHNLETTDTCGLNAAGDQVNTPSGLAAIADNGGFTRTMALLPGSAAIDTGNEIGAPATDQRGVSRPQDGDDNGTATSDIGAFEVENPLFTDGFETGDTFMWSGWVP